LTTLLDLGRAVEGLVMLFVVIVFFFACVLAGNGWGRVCALLALVEDSGGRTRGGLARIPAITEFDTYSVGLSIHESSALAIFCA
jgi:hypothetical protein